MFIRRYARNSLINAHGGCRFYSQKSKQPVENNLYDPVPDAIKNMNFKLEQKDKCLQDAFSEIKKLNYENTILARDNKVFAGGLQQCMLSLDQYIQTSNDNAVLHAAMNRDFKKFLNDLIENMDDDNELEYIKYMIKTKRRELNEAQQPIYFD